MPHPTATPPPRPGPVALTDDETPDFLERHRVAVLVFVDASTEASRKVLDRAERIALALVDRAAFGVLDVRRHALVAKALDVESVPEMLVFESGRNVDRLVGVVPERIVEESVKARLR